MQNGGETTTLTSLFSSRKSDSRPGLRHRSHCPLSKMGFGAAYRSCLDADAAFVPTVCALGYESYFEKVISCLLLITEYEKLLVTYHCLLSLRRLLITLI